MSEWKKVRLGDCCLIGDGTHASLKRQEKGVLYITAKNLTSNGLDISKVDYISEELFNKHFKDNTNSITRPIRNDIIFSIIGSLGACYLVKDEKFGISSSVAIFRSKGEIIPLYLFYYLKSETLKSEINSIKGGVAQGFMSLSKLGSLSIYYPSSIKLQHRIASILSRYDDLIENYQRQIKLLEEAAQRLYKEWFVDLRFPGHETTKFVDGIPEGWEKKKLGEFADIIMGQSPKSEFYNNENIGLPFHQGVGNYGSRFVEDNIYSSTFNKIAESNSILFSVRAPVGRLNITKNKIAIGRGLAAITHKNGCKSFLFYLLKDKFFKDNIIGNGSIFASISKDELHNLEFLIPTENLILKYNTLTEDIDKSIKNIDTQIRSLTEARDRLLPKLMNGEIEV